MKNYQHLYSHFLRAHPGVQHFACHSHHYWPDVTLEAHIQYWKDSCLYVDEKWNYFFSEKIPQAQKLICENLNLSKPEQIVFAPNTHELIYRVLSCFAVSKKIRVLTTDAEFYSFDRQIQRLEEAERAEVVRVSTQPFATLEDRLLHEIQKQTYDLIFLSQVFFNSGVALKDLTKIVKAVTNPETLVVIDGYHAFMALPTDLRDIEERVFYVAGSYKYAQGGEGCCFMWVPPVTKLRPEYTGWFAGFSSLANYGGEVGYSGGGFRFAGSTMDYAALYRLTAVLQLFKQDGITVKEIHGHVKKLQEKFLIELSTQGHKILNVQNLLHRGLDHHGHFLTFQTPSESECAELAKTLWQKGIQTDFRKDRLRFGFGLYHDGNYHLGALR